MSAPRPAKTRHYGEIRRGGERGAATVWVMGLVIVFAVVAGMVIDGGYALAAKRKAGNQAEQAARIGADALSTGSLRSGNVRVDPSQAIAAAHHYLGTVGATGSVKVRGDQVVVTVRTRQDTQILGIVGIGSLPVHESAAARSIDEDTQP